MAIPYESKPLPAVSSFAFDINRWAGVNKIKGSQYDYEMSDCKNMSSDNFPYASPRKPREKLIDEAGIKRIYKVEGDRIYYIDSEDYLCYCENGVKTYLQFKNENEEDVNMYASKVCCANNYDNVSIFYPSMNYVTENSVFYEQKNTISLDVMQASSMYIRIMRYTKEPSLIIDKEMKNILIRNVAKYTSETYKFKHGDSSPNQTIYLCVYLFDSDGKNKLGGMEDKFNGSQNIQIGDFDTVKKECLYCELTISAKLNEYSFEVPDNITIEDGDYMKFVLYHPRVAKEIANVALGHLQDNINFVSERFDWFLVGEGDIIPSLNYGVVYNNRIVGVSGSDIRASALGDFTNFYEFADEAGNPSATGAYATDVGSAGDFTGISAYNNVLLLFKKDIVYEMYGSMPYTITELCTTGCIDNDSIVSIDGVLYWASPKGIVRYSGGVPSVISAQTDINTQGIAKAGTDGRKYYVYDGRKTYVYDTYYQMWHIEDEKPVKMRYNHINDLYTVYEDGIYKANSGNAVVEWEFTTKDYTFSSAECKNLSKLWTRADMPRNSRLEIHVRQNGGEWKRVAVKTAEADEMFDFKLRVKKCDSYTLKFKGKGDVRILDIHGKVTVGTSKHRSGASLNVYRR